MRIEDIRAGLHDRRLQVVADATGIHVNTLRILRDDTEANPTLATLEKVAAYLEGRANG